MITNYRAEQKQNEQEIINAIIGIVRYGIWKRRCKDRYGKKPTNIMGTLATIQSEIHNHLKLISPKVKEKNESMGKKCEDIIRFLTHKPP